MPAEAGRELDAALRRLQELIGALDAAPDPAAAAPARELVSLVLDLHGIGLARLMSILTAAPGNDALLARAVEDDQIRSMLLLHGLHPDDLDTRVRRSVERLRPHLGVHGLRLDVVEIVRGTVRLRVQRNNGAAIGAALLMSLPLEIEGAIVDAAPDVEGVVIDGLDLPGAVAAADAAG